MITVAAGTRPIQIWKIIALFYAIAIGFTWAVWLPAVIAPARFASLNNAAGIPVMICLGTLGPLLGCFVAHRVETGNWRAVRIFPATPRRAAWIVIGPLLVLFTFFFVFPAMISKGAPANWRWHPQVLIGIVWPMVNYNLLGGPLFEEFGWRGFLQPHLERLMPPWTAAICLAIPWAFWHFPLFMMHWSSATPVVYGITVVGLALIMSFAFNGSGQAVIVAILMHAAFNASSRFVPAFLGDTSTRSRPSGGTLIACAFLLVGGALAIMTVGRLLKAAS